MRRIWLVWVLAALPLAALESFRIGFYQPSSKAMNSTDFKIGMEIWLKEMAGQYGIDTKTYYYKDPKKLARAFRDKTINMAVATPLVFVRYFDKKLLLPGVVGFKTSKEKSSKMLVLVRKKDRDKPLAALLRRPVAIPQIADNARLFMRYQCRKRGLGGQLKFLQLQNGGQAILKLFFKKTDIAVVSQATFDTAAELNPQVRERLVPYMKADLPIGSYTYIRKGIDPELYRTIIKHALNMPDTPRGKQVLILFQTDTVEMCNVHDLDSTEAFYKKYRQLLRRQKMTKPGASHHE